MRSEGGTDRRFDACPWDRPGSPRPPTGEDACRCHPGGSYRDIKDNPDHPLSSHPSGVSVMTAGNERKPRTTREVRAGLVPCQWGSSGNPGLIVVGRTTAERDLGAWP